MSHFESTAEAIPALGIRKTPEQIAEEREERERREADKVEFLANEKKKRDAVDSVERRAQQRRSEEILKAEVVEIVMRENPNLDETSAKIIYENTLKEKIAVERFMRAYFGESGTKFGLRM